MPIVDQHSRAVVPDENFLDPHTVNERKRDAHERAYVAPATPVSRDTHNANEALIENCKAIIAAGPRAHGEEYVQRHRDLLDRLILRARGL